MAITDVCALVRAHEGCRLAPYHDSLGYPTIGIGHLLSREAWADLSQWAPITEGEAEAIFSTDLARAADECRELFGDAWGDIAEPTLASARQAALIDMVFELGEAGLGKFHLMIAAIGRGDWEEAARQAHASLWDRQVPKRAADDEALLRTDDWAALA